MYLIKLISSLSIVLLLASCGSIDRHIVVKDDSAISKINKLIISYKSTKSNIPTIYQQKAGLLPFIDNRKISFYDSKDNYLSGGVVFFYNEIAYDELYLTDKIFGKLKFIGNESVNPSKLLKENLRRISKQNDVDILVIGEINRLDLTRTPVKVKGKHFGDFNITVTSDITLQVIQPSNGKVLFVEQIIHKESYHSRGGGINAKKTDKAINAVMSRSMSNIKTLLDKTGKRE